MSASPHGAGRAYDHLAEDYDEYHVDSKSLAENAFIAGHLGRRIGPEDRVVDVGCGTGLLLDLIPLPPDRYVGIDISAGMLERARRKYPEHRFVQGNAETPADLAGLGGHDLVVSLFGSASYCQIPSFAASVRTLAGEHGRYFLMYCGPHYLKRSTYINRGAQLLEPHRSQELIEVYAPRQIWGMSWLVDLVPSKFPVWAMELLLEVDVRTVGRVTPDRCYFLIVEG